MMLQIQNLTQSSTKVAKGVDRNKLTELKPHMKKTIPQKPGRKMWNLIGMVGGDKMNVQVKAMMLQIQNLTQSSTKVAKGVDRNKLTELKPHMKKTIPQKPGRKMWNLIGMVGGDKMNVQVKAMMLQIQNLTQSSTKVAKGVDRNKLTELKPYMKKGIPQKPERKI